MAETADDVAPSANEGATGEKVTGEEATGHDTTGAEPTGEEPTREERTGEEPTREERTGEEPTREERTDEEPTGEEPTGEESTGEDDSDEEGPSLTELLERFGRNVGVLLFRETQLAGYRNLPEVRRAARDVASLLIAGLAFLTAFVFVNVAALSALSKVMSRWLAALLLCGAWLALGSVLALALTARAERVGGLNWWRFVRAGREEKLDELERARAEAEDAVRETLGRLAPAMTVEIASASVAVAGDAVEDVVEVGGDILDASDEMVEELAENLPAGSVVNQMFDVVLIPGRLGVKVATTVLRRGNSRH